VWRLDVSYTDEVGSAAPRRLFLKCSNPALAPGKFDAQQLRQEIVFYQTAAPAMAETVTIPCYSTAYAAETGASHLLLKDVSETHAACPVPPVQSNYEQAVDALAGLHAFWWDHPRLGQDVGQFPTLAQRQREWSDARTASAAFAVFLGDALPPAWQKIYERVVAALPDLYQRHAAGKNLTLVHGDAHFGNLLFPKGEGEGGAYLLDWQFWHPTIGGTDLAFLLASETETETRRLFEHTLLRRYYRQLLARGVAGYAWEECWDDYRLSVILVSIFIPVWRWSLFHWEADMAALQRGMTAFEDLHCAEFI
jgi:hypothetical protein